MSGLQVEEVRAPSLETLAGEQGKGNISPQTYLACSWGNFSKIIHWLETPHPSNLDRVVWILLLSPYGQLHLRREMCRWGACAWAGKGQHPMGPHRYPCIWPPTTSYYHLLMAWGFWKVLHQFPIKNIKKIKMK